MKRFFTLIFLMFSWFFTAAQEMIALPHEIPPPTIRWEGDSKTFFSELWDTQVVTNVSVPVMQAFVPESPNGTSVIVAPGGGLFALSINSEGNEVAKWLNSKGITAFVLQYRLVPTGEDGVQEITDLSVNNPGKIMEKVRPLLPYSVKDGLHAIRHVRENAGQWGIDPEKIGFMGFSAGGAVTMGVAYSYDTASRPDFLVPVYPWTTAQPVMEVPSDAPPMLIICATDDPLGLAEGSIALYTSWHEAKKPVGIHMYAKGGHGFGMKKQGLPSDQWIERFYEWAVAQDLTRAAE